MSDDDGGRETRSRSRSKSPQAASSNTGNSLYAAGLPIRLNKTEFEELFAKYGRLASCDLIEDPITHESRGFGFVVYEDSRDADDALKALNDKEVYGKRIRVEKSKRSKPHAKSPGQYLGPASASATFRARQRDRSRDRPRDRSRDRRSPPRNRSRDRRDRSPPSRHRSRDRRERSRDRDDRHDDRQRDRSRSRDRRR